MKAVFISASAMAIAQILAPLAFAHHSFGGVFDGSRTVDVEGVVQEFRFVNPHAELTLEVTNAQGGTELTTVEFDGRLNLTNADWTPDTIKPGEHVTIHGNPARSGDGRIWFLGLTRSDGTQLVRPSIERHNTIEEIRRQRAQQRSQQAENEG
jgi:hypothetical protein